MSDKRRKPFIWPTWISGLLSGDKHCQYAAWYRAHYFYLKREDADRAGSLTQWKADHAKLVADVRDRFELDGWTTRLEDQNKFTYSGVVANVGGCPDIVALRPGLVTIVDGKTGKKRDSDAWQAIIYGVLLPLCDEALGELVVSGCIVYGDGAWREIQSDEIVRSKPDVIRQIKMTASSVAPRTTPSASECGFCDVDECPDRVGGEGLRAEGDAF